MKIFGSIHSANHRFFAGYNLKRFALGFSIDRYSLSIDLVWFWFSIEW